MLNHTLLVFLLASLASTRIANGANHFNGVACFGGFRRIQPALRGGDYVNLNYGIPVQTIPGQGFSPFYGGHVGLPGLNQGLGFPLNPGYVLNGGRFPHPVQQRFDLNTPIFPQGLGGPNPGNGVPLSQHHPGDVTIFPGFPVPTQSGGGTVHLQTPALSQSDTSPSPPQPPPRRVVVRVPFEDQANSNGHYPPNHEPTYSGPPSDVVVDSNNGVTTPNEYSTGNGNTIVTGDGIIVTTSNGEVLPPAVGRSTSHRRATPNGFVTSDEVVITRGGRLPSASRMYMNRVYS